MLCFGSGPMFIIWSLNNFTAMSSGSGRIIVAGFVSVLFCYITGNNLPREKNVWFYCTFFGLISLGLPFLLMPLSLRFITTSELAIYLSSVPLFVLLLAQIFLKEKITKQKWLGFIIGIFGLIILSDPYSFSIQNSNELLASILCIIISICLASGGIVLQRMPKYNPISFSAGTFFVATLLAIPVFLFSYPNSNPSLESSLSIVFVGVVSTFLGGLCRILLVKRAGAVFTSINGYLVPLVTCSLGIIFLNETLDVNTILSFLIVITGVLISQDLHNKFLKL
ncbi:MAG: hypothetical protein CMN37_01580 [SAR116 cluster bacterium]|nr:hypothetical protein [SAR116 cluster bacterium]